MNLQAVCHIPMSNYAFAAGERELRIRLRTAKDDCTAVVLVISQKHRWREKTRLPMEKVASDRLFDYYEYGYFTDDPRLGYYFELTGGETVVYSEPGFSETFDDANAYFYYFQYPYINPGDVHHVPDWVDGAVFYQIFVDRFCNGDSANDPPGVQPWGDLPQAHSFFGGDLRGILDKLGYLEELGINGIYLTPVFRSPSNHKYDTVDYREVDEAFGSREVLCELVARAHEKGIRVILDGVFNHSSSRFFPFRDVVERGRASPYRDWFHIDGYPVATFTEEEMRDYEHPVEMSRVNYRVFGTSPGMPKLNTENPGLKKYLLDAVAEWTRSAKIDGWRLDVSDEIDHAFWRDFRKTVKEINPQAVIIGENWHNAYPWLQGDQFDGVMNYPVTKCCIEYFAMQKTGAAQFAADLNHCLMWNSAQANRAMLNLLDSHDTVRFFTSCGGDLRRLKLAILFLFSYVGIPCIYYGDEIGMQGGGDPDCRRTFPWDESKWNGELFAFYREVIRLRKTTGALRAGTVRIGTEGNTVKIVRSCGTGSTATVLNNTGVPHTLMLPAGARWLLRTEPELAGEALLAPYSGGIYAFD